MPTTDALLLSKEEARAIMLAAQALLHPPPAAPGLDELVATIERLGVVQIDAINVVARSQYLVLWSRLGPYRPEQLDATLFPQHKVFEYWSHAASIVPMRDYPYYRPRMLAHAAHPWTNTAEWRSGNAALCDQVLDRIRTSGPLSSNDFETPADARRSGPWDWYGPKDSRRALEVLWTTGELMIHSRQGILKRYDLRERVLQEAFGPDVPGDDELPSEDEQWRYWIRRTFSTLGISTQSWLRDYFRLPYRVDGPGKRRFAAEVARLLETGEIVQAAVEGLNEPAYVDRERLLDLERFRAGLTPRRTTLLSPFDNLIWDRARARELWNYEVCFEAYVVPAKRQYGYYCLAILHGGQLVGRLDPKWDRERRRLLVHSVYLEPGIAIDQPLLNGLAGALHDLARFLGATSIELEKAAPAELVPLLRESLALDEE